MSHWRRVLSLLLLVAAAFAATPCLFAVGSVFSERDVSVIDQIKFAAWALASFGWPSFVLICIATVVRR